MKKHYWHARIYMKSKILKCCLTSCHFKQYKTAFDVTCGYNGCEADPVYFTGLTCYMDSSLKQEIQLLFT